MKLKIILYILALMTIIACSSVQFSLEDYQNYPVKYTKQLVKHPEGNFEIFIPHNWEWKSEYYDDVEIFERGIKAFSPRDNKNNIDILSVREYNGFISVNKMEDEYYSLLESQQQNSFIKIIESGETEIFETKTYFIHSKSNTGKNDEIELLTFITENKKNENYFLITASTSRTDELKKKMSVLVQSVKTFKQKEKAERE